MTGRENLAAVPNCDPADDVGGAEHVFLPGVPVMKRLLLVLLILSGCAKPRETARPAPELAGAFTWLNSPPLRLAELRGKVVLLDFFEYSCVNCLRTFPYVKEWQKRYADRGLVIIGVHAPQYEFSMDPKNVAAAVARFGLTYPVVVDSHLAIAESYANRYWPRKIVVDAQGLIRMDWIGEGGYVEMELLLQRLLQGAGVPGPWPAPVAPVRDTDQPGAVCYPITRELYLGHIRGRLANAEQVPNQPVFYRAPAAPPDDQVYAVGEWVNHSEYLRHHRDAGELEDYVGIRYRATEVNAVLRPELIYWLQVFVQQDGQWLQREVAGADVQYDEAGRSYLKVDGARMYQVIGRQPYGRHELRFYVAGKGLSVYSFSFGTCVVPPGVDVLKSGPTER